MLHQANSQIRLFDSILKYRLHMLNYPWNLYDLLSWSAKVWVGFPPRSKETRVKFTPAFSLSKSMGRVGFPPLQGNTMLHSLTLLSNAHHDTHRSIPSDVGNVKEYSCPKHELETNSTYNTDDPYQIGNKLYKEIVQEISKIQAGVPS